MKTEQEIREKILKREEIMRKEESKDRIILECLIISTLKWVLGEE